ncbi:MAG TPA: trypsin-like peptidase domain-containing protein [Acidimicrobiales bacterium]|nr:trypsin-like peptidase domain-containing protein [Acidimicrobiales bacterium]
MDEDLERHRAGDGRGEHGAVEGGPAASGVLPPRSDEPERPAASWWGQQASPAGQPVSELPPAGQPAPSTVPWWGEQVRPAPPALPGYPPATSPAVPPQGTLPPQGALPPAQPSHSSSPQQHAGPAQASGQDPGQTPWWAPAGPAQYPHHPAPSSPWASSWPPVERADSPPPPGWVPQSSASAHGGGSAPPGWPPTQAAGGGSAPPSHPPFYGQYGSSDPYGWARYPLPAAPPPSRPRRMRLAAVAVLVGVALAAGGLGAGLGVSFGGGTTPASSATGVSGFSGSTRAPLPSGNSGQSGRAGQSGSSGELGLPGSAEPGTSGNTRSVQRIANAVDPAVVDINVEDATAGPAAGTGMILTSSGYVLTNNHVIDSALRIAVSVAGRSQAYPATVVGYDDSDDVAVVKIEDVSGLPTVSFGNSSRVAIGQSVVAIGNALGQGGSPTVVAGTVTALDRSISAGDEVTGAPESLHGLIQTDADIQPGDSGGPLVNSRGQVIGMDTAAATAETGSTLGFSIPINQARQLAARMISGKGGDGVTIGLSAFLGINAESPSDESGASGVSGTSGTAPKGVGIDSVIEGSPAAAAGLEAGDVITAIDGKPTQTFADLHDDIQVHRPGQQISVTYVAEADPGSLLYPGTGGSTAGTTHTVQVRLAGIPY